MRTIRNEILGEEYYEIDHKSGLKIFVMPKKEYSVTYAAFATKYGSVDTCFRISGQEQYRTVPEGIAHYLEHKLFESEELGAFERFEKTGASANAYTSFDRTCYLFQCSDNLEKSLEILLDFVKKPYFTEENVKKEQGIIGQEIKMYQDNPDWQVLFNLLRAIYQNNPVRIDLAGTVESISKITPELLYECYNTFYNLNNMVLCVCGNVTPQQVLDVADSVLKEEEKIQPELKIPDEPKSVQKDFIEQKMDVDIPKFVLGFKEAHSSPVRTVHEKVCMNIALDIIAGKTSDLFEEMLKDAIINPSFGYEYFCGRGFALPLFIGESRNAAAVRDKIFARIERLKKSGVSQESFEISRKKLYGFEVRAFNDVDDLANNIIDCYFGGCDLFSQLCEFKKITKSDIDKTIAKLDTGNAALSVVR